MNDNTLKEKLRCMGEIYTITNKVNGKQYVGQTICYSSSGRRYGYDIRFKKHIYNASIKLNNCRLIESAINKYGEDAFICEPILMCNIDYLNYYEDLIIKQYNTLNPNGYNLMTGGGNGRTHSKETRQKMSETRTGKIHKQSTRDKIGNAHRGRKYGNQYKQNISNTSKFRNMSEENLEIITKFMEDENIESLPMYLGFISRNSYGFMVQVPNNPTKQFTSKLLSLREKYDLALEHLQTINGHRSEE